MKPGWLISAAVWMAAPVTAGATPPVRHQLGNITIVNARGDQVMWSVIARAATKIAIQEQQLAESKCMENLEIALHALPEKELDSLRKEGYWGEKITQMPTVGGIFALHIPQHQSNIYVVNDRPHEPPPVLFAHEYAHAYFVANCLDVNEDLVNEEFANSVEQIASVIFEQVSVIVGPLTD